MSNKKLTLEEKIEKSKRIHEEIEQRKKSLSERIDALKKLDAEIDDELEKAEMVTNQAVGRKFRSKMTVDLPLEVIDEIIDFMFMNEDCLAYIDEEVVKYNQELEKAKAEKLAEQSVDNNRDNAKKLSADEVAHSETGIVSV
ncbi:hypothetical protein SAMN02910447_03617 [Ruminococcus sp. YE71]|uniref:hypothetical protein n=1 Tax=unclassified Ruminococcus TaxID=2608920 RepID=UPI0008862D13|nr:MULTISPECIES: hypothetical protein [unclassified Ruminococcus]SDA33138.1 hypothetical protein SAMN02910446_03727 [Ruminococcus sp. YE78]SFW54490.1 hypothetical protein SAMN02910447_03617 [Ruminococcus sp. YE71]